MDEIDKIVGKEVGHWPDVSRKGCSGTFCPIVEGTTVFTKYGTVRTDHILFIGAGCFSHGQTSDLIPELQGRFPIRVELSALERADLKRILREPKNSLVAQYKQLLATEGLEIDFEEEAIDEIANSAAMMNERMENIGARRLQTVMEKLLEDVSFDAPEMEASTVTLDREFVKNKLSSVLQDTDVSRYIL